MFPISPSCTRAEAVGGGFASHTATYTNLTTPAHNSSSEIPNPLPKHKTERQASWVGQPGFGLSLPLRRHANKQTNRLAKRLQVNNSRLFSHFTFVKACVTHAHVATALTRIYQEWISLSLICNTVKCTDAQTANLRLALGPLVFPVFS